MYKDRYLWKPLILIKQPLKYVIRLSIELSNKDNISYHVKYEIIIPTPAKSHIQVFFIQTTRNALAWLAILKQFWRWNQIYAKW